MWYIILLILGAIYALIYLVIPRVIGGFIGAYIIQPTLWVILGLIVLLIAKNQGLNIWSFKKIRKWEIGKTPFHAALLVGGFQISLLIIIGLIIGFGKSPYSHEPLSILTNFVYVFSALISIEIARSYLVKKGSFRKKNLNVTLILTAVLFMFIYIPFAQYSSININEPTTVLKFLGEYIIVGLAMGLFASYLVYLGGALSSIGYMGLIQGFYWFSPMLPNTDWILTALVGTIGPATGFIIIQNSIQLSQIGHKRRIIRKKIKDPALSWTAVAIIGLLFVFFSLGYLGVQPTIIYSGSMQPAIEVGDIVLIQKASIESIKVGDIIQFQSGSNKIVHRVYEINKAGKNITFITKGDANKNPDFKPILQEQILGKASFTIPRLGWIQITIRELFRKISTAI